MKQLSLILLTTLILSFSAFAHHYKGLPHYNYFDNYPQVPTLEFIKETPTHEIFITIYNFQGMNLEQVESPDDVRFYMFIYDIDAEKVFLGKVDFEISSHGQKVYKSGPIDPEQESIYHIQHKFTEQDDLMLTASFVDSKGNPIKIDVPIQITKTFFQKYGVYILIAAFFFVVGVLKTYINRSKTRKADSGGSQSTQAA